MKKVLAAVLLIVVLAGITPFVNGLIAERIIRDTIEQANATYAESNFDYSLEIIRYDRGFYTSDIEWKINFGELKAVYGIDEMIFTEHARHGYTGVVSATSFDRNPWFQQFVEEKLDGRNPFAITTSYSLWGDIRTTLRCEPFSFAVENDIVEIQAGKLAIATDSELKQFTADGNWQGLTAADKITLGASSMKADITMLSTFLWDGFIEFSTQDLSAASPGTSLTVDSIKTSYFFDHDSGKNMLSGRTSFDMAGFSAGDKQIERASGQFALNNMDAQGYEDFMKTYTQLISEAMANVAAMQEGAEQAEEAMAEQLGNIGMQLVAAYEKLLQKDLELHLSELSVLLAEGEIKADITLRLLRDMTLMQFAPIIGQPDLALGILYLKSDITLPVDLVGEPPLLVTPTYPRMETGLFVKEGDTLRHSAETRDGTLFLNGREFVLAQP